MTNKKIPPAVAVTFGVWLAAIGSAAALTYDLNRPVYAMGTAAPIDVPLYATQVAPAKPISGVQPVLYVRPVTIVGRYRPPVPRLPKTFESLSGKHCADWRELEMGSGRVQLCE